MNQLALSCRIFNSSIVKRSIASRIFVLGSASTTSSNGQFSDILREDLTGSDEGITVLTLQKRATKNAISRNLLSELSQHLENLAKTPVNQKLARAVILRSSVERVFCAGADLKERAMMSEADVGKFVSLLRNTFSKIESLPMPTIAVIDGAAMGGGLEMAMCCDIRVAGEGSKFALPETKLAIIPGAGGTQRLPLLVGAARAKDMIFTGRVIDPVTAEKYGLVQYSVQGSAYTKGIDIARDIVKAGPVAVRMAKLAIVSSSEANKLLGLQAEEKCYAQVIPTKDRTEGLTSFKEKRAPVYKGE